MRNRLLSSARFQRWASGFYPTRFVARRRTRALFDLCAGFVYSQVFFACVRLGVLEMLSEGPKPLSVLAEHTQLDDKATRRLFEAAASLGLVERLDDQHYALGAQGAAALGNPAVAAMVDHHDRLYADLVDPVALLRDDRAGGALARYWPYAGHAAPTTLDSAQIADYSRLMTRSQDMISQQILQSYPFGNHRRLLDIGGGEGLFAISAAKHAPNLEGCVFDLPAVAQRACARIDEAGLSQRLRTTGGDFLRDAWPQGADLITLVRVIHDHDDDSVREMLRRARVALGQGGRLLIAEPMVDTRGAERIGAAYFGFYLLAMGQGRARTADEHAALLRAAGFADLRFPRVANPLLARVIVASTSDP